LKVSRFMVMRIRSTLLLLALLCWVAPPAAAGYPEKPITLILPYPVTGSAEVAGAPAINKVLKTMQSHAAPPLTDVLVTEMRFGMSAVLGQSVVVERRSRGRALEAMHHVAHAAPDGYRLLLGGSDNLPLHLPLPGVPPLYAERTLLPVAMVARMPVALITRRGLAAVDVHELIRHARRRPGHLNFATAGEFSIGHVAGELLKKSAGIHVVHVPFNGGIAAVDALVKRQVDFAFVALAAAMPFLDNGRLRLLGLAEREPYPTLPHAPLIAGPDAVDFEVGGWYGVFAPPGTPPAVVARISAGVAAATAAQQTRQALLARGLLALHLPATEFAVLVQAEGKRRIRLTNAPATLPP
jgi:tripartite-type tricarboxylate transporter receptor subunit TctC